MVHGRPRSLSPEQARGDPVDVRADIFSLGALLFELCAGQPLYPNEAIASLLWKVAAGDYPPLRPRLAHIDPGLVEIIETALAVNPDDRFRSAREFDRALDSFRAARGLRVSSRALAQVVTMTWPTIKQMRLERLDGQAGELEGAQLILPPEAPEPEAPRDPSGGFSIGDPSGGYAIITKADADAALAKPLRTPNNPLVSEIGSASGGYPKPSLPPAAFTSELPRPRAPRKGMALGDEPYRARRGWRLYVAAVLLLSGLVFGAAWFGGDAPPPEQVGSSRETAAAPTDS